jgi:general secretion pathway protein A
MYEQFYGLTERPFTLFPDPDFLYLSPQHKLARAYLEYGLTQRLGFVVLTGEIGTGKTTLVKSLLKTRAGQQRLGVLYQTSLSAEDLLELLLREFEIRGHYNTRVTRLAAFNKFLIQSYSRGEHVVLIVDEAQNLGPAALEELRLLSNIQSDKEPLLQVILVGQPNLRDRLRHPALRQLAQRVGVHFHLQPLDEPETKEYIQFRLARAGGGGIFTDSALEKIYSFTLGVPRRINAWCDLALVAGFAEGRREIDGDFLETVVSVHGEALEGPDAPATPGDDSSAPSEEPGGGGGGDPLVPFAQTSNDYGAGSQGESSNHRLHREVMEISHRLTRLEGMVLEMTSQLLPALARTLPPSRPEDRSLFVDPHPNHPPDSIQAPVEEDLSPPPRRWWAKIFKP